MKKNTFTSCVRPLWGKVTMDSQRARPHSLLARVSSQPVSMSSYGLPSGAYSGADLSRKAEEIVSKVLDTSPCPPQEEVQCPLALAPITEQETPLPSPTNERGDHISQNILHPLHAVGLICLLAYTATHICIVCVRVRVWL